MRSQCPQLAIVYIYTIIYYFVSHYLHIHRKDCKIQRPYFGRSHLILVGRYQIDEEVCHFLGILLEVPGNTVVYDNYARMSVERTG